MPPDLHILFSGLCAFATQGRPPQIVGEARVFLLAAGNVCGLQLGAHNPRLVIDLRLTENTPDEVIVAPDGSELGIWHLSGECAFPSPSGMNPNLTLDWGSRAGAHGAWTSRLPDAAN